MRDFLSLVALLSLAATDVSAHYIFNKITIAGKAYGTFEGIRQNTNYNSPVTDLASKDLICNQGGISGEATAVLPAKAGDSFTIGTDTPVYHDGPVSLYLSKSTGSVTKYSGAGGWTKILDWGPEAGSGNALKWPMRGTYTSTIPKCIPNGEYLLRIQSLGIHNPYPAGLPQFYISCAQLNITGGTGTMATWTQDLKIPGVFKSTDSGYTANIYNGLKNYEVPGGPVWKGC